MLGVTIETAHKRALPIELQLGLPKLVGFEPTTSRLAGEVTVSNTSEQTFFFCGVTISESFFCQVEVTLTYTSIILIISLNS